MNTSSSGHPPGSPPPMDKERQMRKRDAGKTEDRDLEHGEGGTLGLDKPEDLRRDD